LFLWHRLSPDLEEVPCTGKLTPEELKAISQTLCAVLKEMGLEIQWIRKRRIDKRACQKSWVSNVIIEVSSIISPATAEK
jgi:hypothetical protein